MMVYSYKLYMYKWSVVLFKHVFYMSCRIRILYMLYMYVHT